MAFEIKDRLTVSIFFNKQEFPFERSNSLDFIHMSSSARLAVPMLHFVLLDNLDFLSAAKHLSDGARIQIVIQARGKQFSTTYSFFLNAYRRTPAQGGYRYEIDAYLNSSTYWHSSSKTPKRGTSYTVIKSIAGDCGLDFEGDSTIDDMVWFPRNLNYHEWARQVAERGYVQDGSMMQLALNFDRSLVYRNITKVRPVVEKFVFGEEREGFITATDVEPKAVAGSINHMTGYADALVEQDTETGTALVHKDVVVSKGGDEGTLMMSSVIKGSVKQARVVFAPLDAGNVHSEYEKAFYQNRRLNNLFNVTLEIVTQMPTKLKIFDRIKVLIDNGNGYLKSYSGEYLIVGRVVYIQAADYYEKFEVIRKTMNAQLDDSVG